MKLSGLTILDVMWFVEERGYYPCPEAIADLKEFGLDRPIEEYLDTKDFSIGYTLWYMHMLAKNSIDMSILYRDYHDDVGYFTEDNIRKMFREKYFPAIVKFIKGSEYVTKTRN